MYPSCLTFEISGTGVNSGAMAPPTHQNYQNLQGCWMIGSQIGGLVYGEILI